MTAHLDEHRPPSGGPGLTRTAVSATVHCLTGCAIGEVLGMVLATWWGWSNVPSIVLSIVLAFGFGYSLNDDSGAALGRGMAARISGRVGR